MTKVRMLMALGVVAALAAYGWLNWPAPYVPPPLHASQQVGEMLSAALHFQGVASCAGRSCHGSLEPVERRTSWQMEYSLWAMHDPHARAFQVLHNEQSKAIAMRLGLANGQAHEATECLVCHVTPSLAHMPEDGAQAERTRRERINGVGCEACHGSAKSWLDAHLARDWPAKSAEVKARDHGLTNLGDAATLAQSCTGCHVGAPAQGDLPARDVNHDFIAAGHPRLMFEASSYLANLPKHWRPKPRNEMELWAVGQVVSAEAALALLSHRAQDQSAPWPEFAEYDCASCHHDLTEPSWRQQANKRRPGSMAWGGWHFTMPHRLADWVGAELTNLQQLGKAMSSPAPSRSAALTQIAKVQADLSQLRSRVIARRDATTAALEFTVLQQSKSEGTPSWESMEQTYLALQSFRNDTKERHELIELEILASLRRWPTTTEMDPHAFFRLLQYYRKENDRPK